MKWVTIELSNYPTQFTHQDVLDLFQGFTISPEFTLPNAVNFTHPLRTFIKIAGQEESKRAVHEMRWRLFGGRVISVKMAEDTGHEEVNQTAEEVVDETDREDVNHTAGEVVEETGHEGDKQKNEKLAVQQKIEIISKHTCTAICTTHKLTKHRHRSRILPTSRVQGARNPRTCPRLRHLRLPASP